MSLLEDVISGAVKRAGVKVVETEQGKGIVFEGFDALLKNSDLVLEITGGQRNDQATQVNYANWGIVNGTPVCIDGNYIVRRRHFK